MDWFNVIAFGFLLLAVVLGVFAAGLFLWAILDVAGRPRGRVRQLLRQPQHKQGGAS